MDKSSQKMTGGGSDPDFAQDANRSDRPGVRGEQTASAMETKLSDLEQRIDDLLASMDERSRDTKNVEVDSKQGEKTR
ncbi:hypothetical protein MMC34_006289 [Xylographa carneopallida]|nr:hypothetical protein [Xylographa carneopallida]